MSIPRSGRPARLRGFIRLIRPGQEPIPARQPGRHVRRSRVFGVVLAVSLAGTVAGCTLVPDGRVAGRVTDLHTGQPLARAQVHLEGAGEGAVTDEDGVYRLTGIEPGAYTLVAELIGYGSRRIPGIRVRPDRSVRVDIDLPSRAVRVEEVRAEPRAAAMSAQDETMAGPDRLVVREANVTLEVQDVEAAADRLRSIADSLRARVQSFRRTESGRGEPRLHFDLRVPAPRLDAALEAVRGLGRVERLSLTGEDVTEQAIDIEARLRHLRALEERFLALLETRAGELGEVLQVERELARVRSEIERWEAQLGDLESRAGRSLLQVTLHEPYPLIDPDDDGLGRRLLTALARAWDNFLTLVLLGIAGLGYLIPIAGVAGLIWWWVRRRGRRLGME